MNPEESILQFNRSKIYEKLDYAPEPKDYSSEISWIVQQQIAATNGIHYIDRIGKLEKYPVYELPVNAVTGEKLMLDIGCGWGRWLVAGSNKGYVPVGIDIRLEFCKTARDVLKDLKHHGYTVVADLENLPFKDNIFDLVWSFSVMQHTHYNRLINCLQHINRILNPLGYTCLEFPNKNGIRNRYGPVKQSEKYKDDFNNWCVRYYTPDEYQEIIEKVLSDFSFHTHSFLGIGVLKEDLKYVSVKNKILCAISRLLTGATTIVEPLKYVADSLYIKARKKTLDIGPDQNIVNLFFQQHKLNPADNLSIISLLRCPKYGGNLTLGKNRREILSLEAGICYPIEDDIPVLIESEARPLS